MSKYMTKGCFIDASNISIFFSFLLFEWNYSSDAVQEMFYSFHDMKECHNEEMDHIEKLRKECVQQKISTDEQTVSLHVYSFNISLSSILISKIYFLFFFLPWKGG